MKKNKTKKELKAEKNRPKIVDDEDDSKSTYTGRTTIGNPQRLQTFSTRAYDGKLEVIKMEKNRCPNCYNDKAFRTMPMSDKPPVKKCTRCKEHLEVIK